jgi:putative phage-type endonuclease
MTTFTTDDLQSAMAVQYPERFLEQGSPEWRMVRLGHVSGSNISDVMSKGKGITRKNLMMKILAERMTGVAPESFTNSAMEWGVEQEPFARMEYEVSRETFVEKTGFWKHPKIEWLGASPDGLVSHDGLVEIKCPNSTTHLGYIFDDKVPSEYYNQIQCQLWVTERLWCDFVSYDPRIQKESKRLFVKRCIRDDILIDQMAVEVTAFLAELDELIIKLGE